MAPSPTGFFHIGSARTALYNWLFAKHTNGTFILRVEDTDVKRSSGDMIGVILEGMKWLGLDWAEIYYQSERLLIYERYASELLESGQAYYCYCNPEALARERAEAYRQKINWQYDRRCLRLSAEERALREKAQAPRAIRFLVPDHPVEFKDIVYGNIRREAKDIEDFVIMRPDHTPTYNFACVVDDHEMGISHVVRGTEHTNNTPKQILLYNAFGWQIPWFAHLPLILGKDRSKLSKRHGAVSILEYKEEGFLPDALFNYIALLGWSPGDNREILSREELIQNFTLERINPANAIFDIEKLKWMNQQYLLKRSKGELFELLKPYIVNLGFMTDDEIVRDQDRVRAICDQMQPRLKVLSDIKKADYFFIDNFSYEEEVIKKYRNEKAFGLLERYREFLRNTAGSEFKSKAIEVEMRRFAEANGIKLREIVHPVRAAITGSEGGPGLFEIMEILGRDKVVQRIDRWLKRT